MGPPTAGQAASHVESRDLANGALLRMWLAAELRKSHFNRKPFLTQIEYSPQDAPMSGERDKGAACETGTVYLPGETWMLDAATITGQLEPMKWLAQDNLTRSSVQLASDGRWEHAFPAESADPGTLRRWLATSGSNVAIESVYCDEDGALKGFFGFRRIMESAEERRSFWQAVVEACAAFQSRVPRQQLVSWLDLLGMPSLFEMQPAGTQVGVFNQWLSAGPVSLRGERLDAADMQAGPDWLRNGATAPICREHFWMMPERFWVAEASSVMDGARYRIDPSIAPI